MEEAGAHHVGVERGAATTRLGADGARKPDRLFPRSAGSQRLRRWRRMRLPGGPLTFVCVVEDIAQGVPP